jgi:hypothetical protein
MASTLRITRRPIGMYAVDAGAELLDHARARHQPVAGDLGVRGRFLEGGDQELGGFHGRAGFCLWAVWKNRGLGPETEQP